MSDDFDDFELPDDIDLGDVPSSGDPDNGRYLCNIEKMEKKDRRDGKGEYINVQFKILDGLAEETAAFAGRSVFDLFNLSAQALWKIKSLIEGVRGADTAKGSRIPNMTNEKVVLDVFSETYQGKVQLRTKGYKTAVGWVGFNMDLTPTDEELAAQSDSGTEVGSAGASEIEI